MVQDNQIGLSILPISSLNVDSIRIDVSVHPFLIINRRRSILVPNLLLAGEENVYFFPLDNHSRLTFLPRGNRDLCRGGDRLLGTFGASPLMRIRGGNGKLEVGGYYKRNPC